jgi:hypothetical protein
MRKIAIALILFQLIGCAREPTTTIIRQPEGGGEKPIIIITGEPRTRGETIIINSGTGTIETETPESSKTPEPSKTQTTETTTWNETGIIMAFTAGLALLAITCISCKYCR